MIQIICPRCADSEPVSIDAETDTGKCLTCGYTFSEWVDPTTGRNCRLKSKQRAWEEGKKMNSESIKQSVSGRFAVCPVTIVKQGSITHFNQPINLALVQTMDLHEGYDKRPEIRFIFHERIIHWCFENDQQRFSTWTALVSL